MTKLGCVFLILMRFGIEERNVLCFVVPHLNQSGAVLKIDGNNIVLFNNNNDKSWLQMVLVFTRDNQSKPLIEDTPCSKDDFGTSKCPEATTAMCKDGFVLVESRKCHFFSSKAEKWHDAQKKCQSMGTTLAHPINANDNTVLLNHIKKNLNESLYWWLGGSDEAKEGDWVWAHDRAPLVYFDWGAHQPDNAGNNEDCMHYHGGIDWKWNDASCTSSALFICQQ